MPISRFRLLCVLIFYIGISQVHAVPTDLVGSSGWSALLKGIKFDGLSDTQANKAGTEIIGDATHPSMYVNYDDQGTTTVSDDILSFRIRIGDETKTTHSSYIFVGVEANGDGIMDAFFSAGGGEINLWDAGTDSNTSPSTTDLSNSACITYPQNASNYNFAPVMAANDPDWDGTNDLGPDSKTDVFVSFSILATDLDAFLAGPAQGITFTPKSNLA